MTTLAGSREASAKEGWPRGELQSFIHSHSDVATFTIHGGAGYVVLNGNGGNDMIDGRSGQALEGAKRETPLMNFTHWVMPVGDKILRCKLSQFI